MPDCLFCKIANKEIPADFVHETEDIAAFKDIHPRAPMHVLVVPKKHIPAVNDLAEKDAALAGKMVLAAGEIAKKMGVAERGYRLIINCGEDGGQIIQHLHLHVLGGTKMGPKGQEL